MSESTGDGPTEGPDAEEHGVAERLEAIRSGLEGMELGEEDAAAPEVPDTGVLADLLDGLEGDVVEGPLVEAVSPEELTSAIDRSLDSLGVEEEASPEVLDLPPREVRAAVESLLLVATRPLGLKRLQACLPGASSAYLRGLLAGLADRYDHEHRGWSLRRLGNGYQLLTREDLHPWVRQLDAKDLPNKLSRSAMETLAVVAYKQPVTRGEIEDVRGVQCGPMLRQLMDLKLVQVAGRKEEVLGRPLLYATTQVFLERFGLASIDDLPQDHEFGG